MNEIQAQADAKRKAIYETTERLKDVIQYTDSENRTRELIEYINGRRDRLEWLDEDLQKFVQEGRDALRFHQKFHKGELATEVISIALIVVGAVVSTPLAVLGLVLALITAGVCSTRNVLMSKELKEISRLTDEMRLKYDVQLDGSKKPGGKNIPPILNDNRTEERIDLADNN